MESEIKIRTITDQFLWESLHSSIFTSLFELLKQDEHLCFEHRLDNIPVLYYDSKKLFSFSVDNQRIRVDFPENYLPGEKIIRSFYLDDISNWENIIAEYSGYQKEHLIKTKQSFPDEVWQFKLAHFFNYGHFATSDYLVINTEYGQSQDGKSYIDFILLKGLKAGEPHIVFCELKYGDRRIYGKSGIYDHLRQYQGYLNDEKRLRILIDDMLGVFQQRCELGLIKGVSYERRKPFIICPEKTTALVVIREHQDTNKANTKFYNELLRIKNDKELDEIRSKTKIIVFNQGEYYDENTFPFDESKCISY